MEYLLLILSIASIFVQVLSEEKQLYIDVHDNEKVWSPNERRVVTCKSIRINATTKMQWISPQGEVVVDRPLRRIYTKKSIQPQKMGYGLNLIFIQTSISDNGVWLCKSGNLIQTHTVCVISPTEFANNNERMVSVNAGSSVKLRCKVQYGNPEPRLQWYRNGEALTDNNSTKYKILTTSTSTGIQGQLTVVSIDDEDSGLYVCQTIQESNGSCMLSLSMNITLQVKSHSHTHSFKSSMTYKRTRYTVPYKTSLQSCRRLCQVELKIGPSANLAHRAYLACISKSDIRHQWYSGNDPIKATFFNTVLHVTRADVNAKLIYTATQHAPSNSISDEFLKMLKVNESYNYDPSSDINILLPNLNKGNVQDRMYIQFMKTDSLSVPYIESDWKPDFETNLQVHNISCYDDQYTIVKIAEFDFDEGTEYFIRIWTESDPAPNPEDLVITTDSNRALYYDHRIYTREYLEGLIHDTFKEDILTQFGIFTICLLIFIIFIGITYRICHRCRRNNKNILRLKVSE